MNEQKSKRFARTRRWIWRGAKILGGLVLVYVAILLIGLLPANGNFESVQNGVQIYVVSNPVHADLILPVRHPAMDWTDQFPNEMFAADTTNGTHMAFGWGDRGFYIETPTWDDLKLSTALNALLIPSECCMHVSVIQGQEFPNAKTVTISDEQYELLTQFILSSFKRTDDQRVQQIPDANYWENDAFFRAVGNYHALNTCNSWVGRALKTTGVKVPVLSPLPGTPTMYFEK